VRKGGWSCRCRVENNGNAPLSARSTAALGIRLAGADALLRSSSRASRSAGRQVRTRLRTSAAGPRLTSPTVLMPVLQTEVRIICQQLELLRMDPRPRPRPADHWPRLLFNLELRHRRLGVRMATLRVISLPSTKRSLPPNSSSATWRSDSYRAPIAEGRFRCCAHRSRGAR